MNTKILRAEGNRRGREWRSINPEGSKGPSIMDSEPLLAASSVET